MGYGIRKYTIVWAAVLALLPQASCRKAPAAPGEVRPARTVLVCMAGDNGLSGGTVGQTGTQERYAVFGEQLERIVGWVVSTGRFLPSQNGFGLRNRSALATCAERSGLPALNVYYRTAAWRRAVRD